jgi:hypothetical protein
MKSASWTEVSKNISNISRTMKLAHKDKVRLFILDQLNNVDDLRMKLDDLSDEHGMDSFKVVEFYENELWRIKKLFNYPQP